MRGDNKKVAYLILIVNLIQLAIQQQANLNTVKPVNHESQIQFNPVNPANDESTIQFKQGNMDSTHIQFKGTQYSFNPQIDEDYSIVHAVVYPLASNTGQKFISSVAKDSFVNKLKHQNSPNSNQDLNQDTQKNSQSQKTSTQQKEIQKKAQEILKEQTIEQQAKLKQQKTIAQQTNTNPVNPPTPNPKDIVKPQQTAHTEQKVQKPVSEGGNKDKKVQKPSGQIGKVQQKQEVSKEDLFAQNIAKDHPQIEKTDKKIKFKEHQIAKPLSITTYAFETKNQAQKMKSEEAKTPTQTIQQPKQQAKKPSSQQQKPKAQTKQIKKPEKQIKAQAKKDKKSEKQNKKEPQRPNTPQKKQEKKQIIVEDKRVESKPANTPSTEKQQGHKQGLDPQLVQQFKKLTKSLSTEPQKIKNSLQFETVVKEEAQMSEWGFFIAKVVIGLTILISIYRATCSSESQEDKIEKGKYSPLGLSEMDTENGLDMTERSEHR